MGGCNNTEFVWVRCYKDKQIQTQYHNWTMRSPKLASCMLYANIIILNSKVGCLINNGL